MLQRSLGAVLAAILLAPGLAAAQTGESPIRLPEAREGEFGSGQVTSTPYSAAPSGGQVVVPGSIPPAADGSEAPSQFVAADQLQQAPVEQRLLTMEKEWHAFQAAQDAQKTKFPTPVTLSGVFQADAVAFSQDDANRRQYGFIEDGAGFRRARLGARGSVTNNMNYFMQMDFAFFGRPTFTDLWVEWTDLPMLGTVRAGQWKQPFSLEVVSSFRYTTFMERSSMFQAFDPFRHIGIGFYNHSEDLMTTWAASMFRTGQDQFGNSISTDGGNGACGRITHLGWWDEASEGRSYMHMGAGYFYNAPPRDSARFRSIPEIFVGEHAGATPIGTSGQAVPGPLNGTPFFVDTLALANTNSVHTPGVELLYVRGPLSIQSEAMAVVVNRDNNPTAVLGGMYAQIGWFLTGEHRPYDRVAGAIDRVKPFEDFFWVNTNGGRMHGMGAWEVAARYSYIDLNDGAIRGGIMQNVTAGVNWYCNPYNKVVFNYIHSFVTDRTGVASEANAWGIRTQVDF